MTELAIQIRDAREEDCPRLAILSDQLGYPMSSEEAVGRLARIAGCSDHALFVAECGGRAVAWIQVSLPRIFETPIQAEIAGLVVDESFRGRGVGRELLQVAERWARERGCAALRVRSNVVRAAAHAFYRRAGFDQIKTQSVFEKAL